MKKTWSRTRPVRHLACRGCSLLYDGITALGVDLEDVEEVILGFSQESNDFVRTVSMRFKFKNMKEMGWYQFYCTQGQTPPRYTIQRLDHISGDTGSEKALAWAVRHLHECQAEHRSCSPTPSFEKALPTRVLDIGLSDKENNSDTPIKLYESNNESKPYACLSYRWGLSKTLKTTKANIESHKAGISMSSFARTHQDAIKFTRKLGIRYLWIDALCIIQDDENDWRKEASKMCSVYQQAELTLAASAGDDSQAGLFTTTSANEIGHVIQSPSFDWDPSPSTGVCVRQSQHHDDFLVAVDKNLDIRSPLMKRGWVFQERLLSPRYLHFGRELIWECAESLACECSILKNIVCPSVVNGTKMELAGRLKAATKEQALEVWQEMVGMYTSLNLTVSTDRLPAFSGLAKEFVRYDLGKFCAGLWEEGFLKQLLWNTDQSNVRPRPLKWQAPSWSWASVSSHVYHATTVKEARESTCEILDCYCEEVLPGSYGEIKFKTGRLIVSGPLIAVGHRWEPHEDPKMSWRLGHHLLVTDGSYTPHAIPDYAWYSQYPNSNLDPSRRNLKHPYYPRIL